MKQESIRRGTGNMGANLGRKDHVVAGVSADSIKLCNSSQSNAQLYIITGVLTQVSIF